MRSVLLLSEGGRIGVICPRSYLYQVTFEPMRRTLLKLGMAPSYIIEMGLGVLDGATVRVALSVFVSGCGTCSYANLTACEKDEKHFNAAFKAICWNSQSVSQIETLPAAAFLFGLSAELKIYLKTAAVRLRAWNGLQTCDDFRFVRLSSEIAGRPTEMWKPFLKPTFFAPYVGVQCTFVNWKEDGREIKAMISQRGESPSRYCNNERKYPASEAWYPDVSERGIGACRVSVPAIPSRTGIALSKPTSLTSGALVAFANSVVAEGLVGVVTPDRHHKPTYLAAVPIPEELASAATDLDNLFENLLTLIPAFGPLDSKYSEPFIGVELKSRGVTALDEILKSLKSRCDEVRKTQQEIDQKVLKALLLSEEDADTLRQMSQRVDPSAWFPHISELDPKISLSEEWIAHQALSVLGGSRQGILPLDEGHLEDFVALLEEALAEKCNEAAGATLRDALSALGVQNLREYVRRADGLYAAFRRLFSASQRRGMPVFNISTLSGSFAVWVDLRRASRDAMFRVQNDYVAPKLAHEQRRLDVLRAEGGANPTTAQRNAIEAQEGLLEELQSFFDEVRRVAPFWKADLDDGVVINLAPLWRLVAQDRAWQKELRTTWDALCRGEYDWAHLAMHLWPERVLPKCATDRSLAIAHGLEDAFWFEDKDGKWKAYDEPRQSIKSLAGSRTSPAVNAALKSLLEAPEIAGGAKRRHKAKAG